MTISPVKTGKRELHKRASTLLPNVYAHFPGAADDSADHFEGTSMLVGSEENQTVPLETEAIQVRPRGRPALAATTNRPLSTPFLRRARSGETRSRPRARCGRRARRGRRSPTGRRASSRRTAQATAAWEGEPGGRRSSRAAVRFRGCRPTASSDERAGGARADRRAARVRCPGRRQSLAIMGCRERGGRRSECLNMRSDVQRPLFVFYFATACAPYILDACVWRA